MIDIYGFYTKSLLATQVIIICFFIIRFFIRKQTNKMKNMLWIILLIRLFIPLSVYTNWGVLLPVSPIENETNVNVTAFGDTENVDLEKKQANEKSSHPVKEDKSVSTYNASIFTICWYIGIAVFLIYYFISKINIGQRMKTARKIPDYENVYEWSDDFSACVIGIISPRIYVPCGLDEEQFNAILRHEKMHIQRGDYFFLMLYFLALALNWFNPLCWVVYSLVRSDIEMACDEQVLRDRSKEERQNYARILIQLCNTNHLNKFPLISFAKGKSNLKKRILNIGKSYQYKKSMYLFAGSIAVIVLIGGIFLYSGSNKNNLSNKNLLQISKEKSQDDFGAAMPRLGYVNDKSLILYDSTGAYLFDLLSNKLVDYVNFEEHELGGIQGDNPTFVAISKNGQSIYLYNNEVKLVYDTAAKTFDHSDFQIDNIELWNPQITLDSIENDTYYNVGGIFQMENDKKCFLAIRKNMTPNYAALSCIIADDHSEEIYTLFY